MLQLEILILPITLLFAIAGIGLILLISRHKRSGSKSNRFKMGSVNMICSVCQAELSFTKKEMTDLPDVEIAMAVRAIPKIRRKKLAEYVCPHCEAAHCFIVEGIKPICVGTNLYVPQESGTRCINCHKHLKNPPWKPGEYDGTPEKEKDGDYILDNGKLRKLERITHKKTFKGNPLAKCPELLPEYGLVCDRCGVVCCVECCIKVTKNRLENGGLLCPRCVRGPLYKFFHFSR